MDKKPKLPSGISSKAGFVSGIVGGLASGVGVFGLCNWLVPVASKPLLSDAVSIANTYIVFTTIIFVVITVFLSVAGLWFTQQFATSKEAHLKRLLEDIEEMLADNRDEIGVKLVEKAFANPDVSRHVKSTLEGKLDQLLDGYQQISQTRQQALDAIRKQLGGKS